jgi:AAA domain-containing protein
MFLLHGSEENYKSMFIVQMAECIAAETPLLRTWKTHGRRRVGIIETEMHEAMLGKRLGAMFKDGEPPEGLAFMREEQLKHWRRISEANGGGPISASMDSVSGCHSTPPTGAKRKLAKKS